MTTSNIKNWVRKASVDEIAEVIAEAADKIYELEDEITALKEDVAYYTALEESAEDDDHITKGMDEW
jgi:phage host-nuclease inhibitor protein Gam